MSAQTTLEAEERPGFDSPEGWAMKYFASAALFTTLGPPARLAPGAVELGLETIWVPHLDSDQRTVGFGGTKPEDLNRTPVWGRLRLGLGLADGTNLVLGWVPPVRVDGVKARLFAAALEQRLFDRGPWQLGGRLYAQTGTARGDLTCPGGGSHRFPPGSPENLYGCLVRSDDRVGMDYLGAELVVSRRFGGPDGPAVYAGAAYNLLDLEFQVNAQTFNVLDRTRLSTEGHTLSWTAGVSAPWGVGRELALEAFYSGLDVRRPGASGVEEDGLFNLRAILRFDLSPRPGQTRN